MAAAPSATLGDADSQAEMLHYAGQIFGSRFDRGSLIQEDRLTPAQFFEDTAYADPEQGLLLIPPPSLDQEALLDPATYGTLRREDPDDRADALRLAYLAAQVPLWFGSELPLPTSGDLNELSWRIELGRQLGRLPAVQNLVRQAHTLCSFEELLERFARQLGIDGRYPLRFRVLLLDSLLALMAHARGPTGQSWVQLRVQPSLRETLWLLLPEGRVLRSSTARHLIRILRQRVEKAEEAWFPATSAGLERAGGSLQDAVGRG